MVRTLYDLVSIILSLIFALSGVSESVVGYTAGEPITATDRGYFFNEEKRLLIGAYYADPDRLALAKEAGLEFFITDGVTQKVLDDCEALGLGIIAGGYNLPRGYGDLSDSVRDAWIGLDMAKYKDHPALWGDDLIDEPGANSFDSISAALNAYYAKTQGKIGLVNLFPAYANSEQLNEETDMTLLKNIFLYPVGVDDGTDRYKKHVSDYINKIDTDYLCVDIYPMNEKVDENGELIKTTDGSWLRNLDILAQACRETGRSLWVITQAAGLTNEGEIGSSNPRWCDEPSDISQQAYASLAFGAGAIIHAEFAARGWWDKGSHMIDANGNTTDTYAAVRSVNEDLLAFADVYGKYQYASTYLVNSTKAAGFTRGRLAVQKNADIINLFSKDALLVGCFSSADDGNAYIVTNMEELQKQADASAVYKVPAGKTLTLYQGGKVSRYDSGEIVRLSLSPGEGVFFTVK